MAHTFWNWMVSAAHAASAAVQSAAHTTAAGARAVAHAVSVAAHAVAHAVSVAARTVAHATVLAASTTAHVIAVGARAFARSVTTAARTTAHVTAVGARTTAHATSVAARTTAHVTAVGARTTAHATAVGARTTAHATAVGARTTAHVTAVGARAVAHTVSVVTRTVAHATAVAARTTAHAIAVVVRAVQRRLPANTGNPVPAIAAAFVLIAGAGLLNLWGTVSTISRTPVPDSLPPVLSLLERYGVTATHYARTLAAVELAYALVILGTALLLAVAVREKRRWARIVSAVLAGTALFYALNAGTGTQSLAAGLGVAGAAITFTKGAAPWFRRRVLSVQPFPPLRHQTKPQHQVEAQAEPLQADPVLARQAGAGGDLRNL
ncbi:hypothetical protein NNX39_02985 [Arthrobacter sp. zg-Y826]|uniref:hypothetical protein n=1 Tax=Arthrobacter jinronghuae TaxID=2964609 RepID=UPI0021081973|nr:hypothetical protein [Arthrobacter jinronghuae]MCQ1955471.1 hypothetical protein [Arthrobacter jinronghuae]